MANCCGNDAKFDGVSDDYKRRLWIVIAINAMMFTIEMIAGQYAVS
jgi:Co/Zn/Cd efflux system component